jgi:hypothetical protein
MKWLAAIVLALSMSLGGVSPKADELPQIPKQTLVKAWDDAMEMCEGDPKWKMSPEYILVEEWVVPEPGWRLYGTYQAIPVLDKKGRPDFEEEIHVYLLATESDKQYEIVLHENLHACWVRRVISEPGFYEANPDSEVFVRAILNEEVPEIYNRMMDAWMASGDEEDGRQN